jgi:hypothetical protein
MRNTFAPSCPYLCRTKSCRSASSGHHISSFHKLREAGQSHLSRHAYHLLLHSTVLLFASFMSDGNDSGLFNVLYRTEHCISGSPIDFPGCRSVSCGEESQTFTSGRLVPLLIMSRDEWHKGMCTNCTANSRLCLLPLRFMRPSTRDSYTFLETCQCHIQWRAATMCARRQAHFC